jgi:hypothetical protein
MFRNLLGVKIFTLFLFLFKSVSPSLTKYPTVLRCGTGPTPGALININYSDKNTYFAYRWINTVDDVTLFFSSNGSFVSGTGIIDVWGGCQNKNFTQL